MTQSLKEFFVKTASSIAGSGNYRVYLESDFPGDQSPLTSAELTDTFMCAAQTVENGRGDLVFFEQQSAADAFVKRLQNDPRFRLIEGPTLTN